MAKRKDTGAEDAYGTNAVIKAIQQLTSTVDMLDAQLIQNSVMLTSIAKAPFSYKPLSAIKEDHVELLDRTLELAGCRSSIPSWIATGWIDIQTKPF